MGLQIEFAQLACWDGWEGWVGVLLIPRGWSGCWFGLVRALVMGAYVAYVDVLPRLVQTRCVAHGVKCLREGLTWNHLRSA